MTKLLEVNEGNFEAEVVKSDLPVLIDFGAIWCGPCKMLDPLVEELAEELQGKVKIVHVDIDNNPNLTVKFNVMGVPTLMLLKDGEPIERMTGYKPKNKILDIFGPHF